MSAPPGFYGERVTILGRSAHTYSAIHSPLTCRVATARAWSPAQREGIASVREKVRQLAEVAKARGQTLPQIAIAWTLRFPDVTTALIGASDIDQLEENAKALENLNFSHEEISRIDAILAS